MQAKPSGPYLILPSLLAADNLYLGEALHQLSTADITAVHLDIMDNHYVPNLSFGPDMARAIRKHFPKLMLDVHLMAEPVDELIEAFAEAGATRISIHPDASTHLDRSLARIQALGCEAGLALNPSTPLECLRWCTHHLDFVLLMTVNPGFGNQAFISDMLPKLRALHAAYPDLPLCVDGGVTENNLKQLRDAGATQFVIGSAIFKTKAPLETLTTMREQLEA